MTDAAFWDKIAPKYSKSKISNPEAYEETLTRVRTYLRPDANVLELGCGTGSTALKLYQNAGSYEGTDISQGMINIANDKLDGQSGPLPNFRVAGLTADDYSDTNPDIVLAFNLLHLVPNLEDALRMIHDLLPTGGLFISKTVALGEKWYFTPLIRIMRAIGKAPYVRTMKVTEIDVLITNAGFKVLETGLYPPKLPSRFVVAQKI